MSKIYLPSGHPAIDILRSEGIDVADSTTLSQNAGSKPPLRIGIINLMPNPDHPVEDFGRLLAQNPDRDIQILDFSPTPENISSNADTIAKRSKLLPLSSIAEHKLDGAFLSGFGKEDLRFEALRFWPELTKALDALKSNKTPVYASCWGAHAALYYHHGVEKTWNKSSKVLGVFDQQINIPDHPFLSSIDPAQAFPMPVSRIGKCNEAQILANPHLDILATSEETGASIVVDDHIIYVTGHPEYNVNSLPDEYRRDIANQAAHVDLENPQRTIPGNVFESDDLNGAVLPALWLEPGQVLINNFVKAVDAHARQLEATPAQGIKAMAANDFGARPRALLA